MSVANWAVAIANAEEKFTEIAVADGNAVTYQREAMFAMQIVGGSEYLQKASPESLRNAVINVASVGLTLSPAHKLAYLVPRDGKACLDISYIGLVKIATDSGAVVAVHATIVRAKDGFEYFDAFTSPAHKFDPFANAEDRGDIIGVYAVAKLANGLTQVETLSREEIEKIRAVSKAKSGPWVAWFEEMAKKSVIKRASKLWPRTERLSQAVQILDQHQGNEEQIGPALVDVDGRIIDEAQEAAELAKKRLQRLLADVAAAPDTSALTRVWKDGVAELNAAKDRESYATFKKATEDRGTALKNHREAA
jgi:recombination protein RecT